MSEIAVKESTEVLAQQNMPAVSQSERLMAAIIEGSSRPEFDIDKMNGMYTLYEKVRKADAEIAYKTAMAKTQSEVPAVVKNKRNKHTQSDYADLGAILKVLLPIAGSNGLSMSFEEDLSGPQGFVNVIGTLSHKDGFSKEFPLSLPFDGEGMKGSANKTPIHAKTSTISYCERRIYEMAYSIPIADDDGNSATVQVQTPEYLDLISGLEKFAAAGTEALRDAWDSLNIEQKRMASPEMLRLKRDAAKVITEEQDNG